jgi:hypothetical protein
MRLQLTLLLVGLLAFTFGGVGVVWFIKRKLARMADNLPGAPPQWEKEIEKLEKPKLAVHPSTFSPVAIATGLLFQGAG